MKKALLIIAIAVICRCSYAQTNTYPSSGNVGIGTTTPGSLLTIMQPTSGATNLLFVTTNASNSILFQRGSTLYNSIYSPYATPGDFAIYDNVNAAVRFYVNPSGYVGIGTTSPTVPLQVNGSIYTTTSDYSRLSAGSAMTILTGASTGNTYGLIQEATNGGTSAGNLVLNLYGGNVLIGKSSQINTTYALDINGNARANEVVVNTTGADFVFNHNLSLIHI